MKKSEILKVLGDYLLDYWVQYDQDFDCNWLRVKADSLNFHHIDKIWEYIARIRAVETGVIEIIFTSAVEID